MKPRTHTRERTLTPRLAVVAGVLALLSAGCGQLGGVHPSTGAAISPVAFSSPGPGGVQPVVGMADSGPTVDIGGVQGPTISGDNKTLQHGGGVTRVVTVTQILPQAPQFQLPVRLNASSASDPLKACPVQAQFSVGDSFGAPRYAGGYHPHAGNDIIAPQYSPIVAPFDGVASADPNTLGGNAVVVRGAEGYVYNAHLVAYGELGSVQTGDVIGYVGNTGDARGGPFHDHFEWHPYHPTIQWVSPYGYSVIDSGDPPAVDPFPYLERACPHS